MKTFYKVCIMEIFYILLNENKMIIKTVRLMIFTSTDVLQE